MPVCYANCTHQSKYFFSAVGTIADLLYPSIETYRVFTLDIHKTKNLFHTNVTISDGTALTSSDTGTRKGKWIFRDHLNTNVSTDDLQHGHRRSYTV